MKARRQTAIVAGCLDLEVERLARKFVGESGCCVIGARAEQKFRTVLIFLPKQRTSYYLGEVQTLTDSKSIR